MFCLVIPFYNLQKAIDEIHYHFATESWQHPFHQKIAEIITPFLKQVKIREDILFEEKSNIILGQAQGTNHFLQRHARILMKPKFYDIDPQAFKFILKHELSHIKHNDVFNTYCIGSVSTLATIIFKISSVSLPYFFVVLGVSIGVTALFSRWREERADDFAIKNSDIEELKGGRRILKASQQVLKNIRPNLHAFRRFFITSEGNDWLDIYHPSLTSRIQKVEKALHARGISIQDINNDESKKLDELQDLISN